MAADGELFGFIHQQRNAGSFHPRFKHLAPREQIVIPFDHVNTGPRIEAPDRVDSFGQLVERRR